VIFPVFFPVNRELDGEKSSRAIAPSFSELERLQRMRRAQPVPPTLKVEID